MDKFNCSRYSIVCENSLMEVEPVRITEARAPKFSFVETGLKSRLFHIGKSFLENTSHHGFRRLSTTKSTIIHIIWTSLIISAWSGATQLLYTSLSNFFAEPVSTQFVQGGARFQMPTFYLCNQAPFSNEVVNRLFHLHVDEESRQFVNYIHKIKHRVDRLVAVHRIVPWNETAFGLAFVQTINRAHMARFLSHRLKSTIMSIKNPPSLSFDDIRPFWHYMRGTCFSFSPERSDFKPTMTPYTLHFFSDSDDLEKTGRKHNKSSLNIEQLQMTGERRIGASGGLVLYVTEPGGYPSMTSKSMEISSGYNTEVKVSPIYHERQNTRHSTCLENTDDIMVEYTDQLSGGVNQFRRSFDICYSQELSREFQKTCECVPNGFTAPTATVFKGVPKCWNVSDLLESTDESVELEFVRRITCTTETFRLLHDKFDDIIDRCRKRLPCNTVTYKLSWSSSHWPLPSMIDEMVNAMDYVSRQAILQNETKELWTVLFRYRNNSALTKQLVEHNFGRLSIAAGEMRAANLKESISVTFSQVFSDCGGILGLWIGLSLLTFAEVIALAATMIYECYRARNSKKVVFCHSQSSEL